jgi:hypothetical protein
MSIDWPCRIGYATADETNSQPFAPAFQSTPQRAQAPAKFLRDFILRLTFQVTKDQRRAIAGRQPVQLFIEDCQRFSPSDLARVVSFRHIDELQVAPHSLEHVHLRLPSHPTSHAVQPTPQGAKQCPTHGAVDAAAGKPLDGETQALAIRTAAAKAGTYMMMPIISYWHQIYITWPWFLLPI